MPWGCVLIPQELINSIQYGKRHHHRQLPPAEYFVKASIPDLGRSVYTFCMCPGGSVIGCGAFAGSVITNRTSNVNAPVNLPTAPLWCTHLAKNSSITVNNFYLYDRLLSMY